MLVYNCSEYLRLFAQGYFRKIRIQIIQTNGKYIKKV